MQHRAMDPLKVASKITTSARSNCSMSADTYTASMAASDTPDAASPISASAACDRSTLPPLIELNDAVVRRQGNVILDVDHFQLEQGQSIAILGPNGAGKSTFIQLMTREILPLHRDNPPVYFKGDDRATLADIKSVMGVVSSTMQDQITVQLPVLEIVCGGLFGALGVPSHCVVTDESLARAHAALDMVGVGHLADRGIKTLSSGQARRVLIARALIHDPEVLVFDEPTTGLDPEGMFYVRKAMRDLHHAGKSIILVTHYPEDIIPEIDRVLMIKDAHIFDDGTKAEKLTSDRMSALFDVPLKILAQDGFYSLVSAY